MNSQQVRNMFQAINLKKSMTLSPEERMMQNSAVKDDTIRYALYGLLAAGGCTLVAWLIIKRIRANRNENLSFVDGSPQAHAKQIRMAIENDNWFHWGTDNELLRQVWQEVPSKAHFSKVIEAYQALYNSNMMRDLKDDLDSMEYSEMLAILSAKPEKGTLLQPVALTQEQYDSWAKRLHTAFNDSWGPFPATDEDAIRLVFLEVPTQAAFERLKQVYASRYGAPLLNELKSELSIFEYPAMMRIINDKPTL